MFEKLVLRLLVSIFSLLLDMRKSQTGSHYAFVKEQELIKEADEYTGISF